MKRTLILRIESQTPDWKKHLEKHIALLSMESGALIEMYILNEESSKKANEILIENDS